MSDVKVTGQRRDLFRGPLPESKVQEPLPFGAVIVPASLARYFTSSAGPGGCAACGKAARSFH